MSETLHPNRIRKMIAVLEERLAWLEAQRGVYDSETNPKPHPDAVAVHFGADYIFTWRKVSDGYGMNAAATSASAGSTSPFTRARNLRFSDDCPAFRFRMVTSPAWCREASERVSLSINSARAFM